MSETLAQITAECLQCQKCPLKEGRTQVVPGNGNSQAQILFIGEGPGKKEDELGKPFVGASGKFLDELLASIELKREDVYIANVVKCRPPENRDPLPEEIAACTPWLKRQITAIQPKIIATLGRFSMRLFLPEAVISRDHGKPQKVGKVVVIPLYHPAVALYNGAMRETLKKDFQVLETLLKKIR